MSAAPTPAAPAAAVLPAASPFTMLGSAAVPVCEGDACLIPGADGD